MTSQLARLYAFAASLLLFFLAWAGIAARPWAAATPRRAAAGETVAAYEQRLRADAALLQQLSTRVPSRSGGPLVRIVTLPPITTTRTS